MRTMTKMFAGVLSAIALALPVAGVTAPDEAQKQLIQRAQVERHVSAIPCDTRAG